MTVQIPLVIINGQVQRLPSGDTISGGAGGNTFIQSTAPITTPGDPYVWIQTGMGDGTGITFWIEDGQ